MELVDRYLQAVGFWLPKAQRQDIIAEISSDLHSQVEEEESGLGRALDERELEQLLKRRGAPLLVAERYLPRRHLIGPRLFPIYQLVLRSAAIYCLLPWLLVWIGLFLFDSTSRGGATSVAIGGALKGLWLIAVYGFVFTTLAFAILERCQAKAEFLESWDPRKLPPVRKPSQMSRSKQVGDMTWNLVVVLWWVGLLRFPQIPGLNLRVVPSIAEGFFWPILALFTGLAVLAAVNAVKPWWTTRRAAIRLTIACLGLVLMILLLISGPWVRVGPGSSQGIADWFNGTILALLVFYSLSFLFLAIESTQRLMGRGPLRHWLVKLVVGE